MTNLFLLNKVLIRSSSHFLLQRNIEMWYAIEWGAQTNYRDTKSNEMESVARFRRKFERIVAFHRFSYFILFQSA